MPIQSINPYNNQVIRTFEEDSDEKINEVLETAGDTFDFWKQTTFAHRKELMWATADVLDRNAGEYARLMTLEMGKPIKDAVAEVKKCAGTCRFYADNAARVLADEAVVTEAGRSYVSYHPLGAVLAVMPWNFPFWQVFRFAAPALMAGNVALLKHASNVPQCALAIEQIFLKAGFPEGVFQTLLVGPEKIEAVIADENVQAVTLTGSEGAGSKVAALAGKYIKKTVLELGGSDAFIVLGDADIQFTAQAAAKARMINTGQSCIAAKRFIVVEPVAAAFTEAMKKYLLRLKMGNPASEEVDYGPMAREDLANDLLEQVRRSVESGAKVALGGDRPVGEGAFFYPTVLTHVRPGMPAYDEELFGPVACIITAKDEDDAVRIANDHRYGLGASIWTKDIRKAEQMARCLQVGAVFVNEIVKSDPRMPFGGVKKSGYGRELSHFGIREFVNIQSVWVNETQKALPDSGRSGKAE
ncbi:MAG TPA: NAD-dependent succinate-semialdehyde dehydrogenase [Cytophagales bacterium]